MEVGSAERMFDFDDIRARIEAKQASKKRGPYEVGSKKFISKLMKKVCALVAARLQLNHAQSCFLSRKGSKRRSQPIGGPRHILPRTGLPAHVSQSSKSSIRAPYTLIP